MLRQSRFYKRHYEAVERPITDLETLPPVTKPMLMDHFDDVVTDTAVTRAEIYEFTTDDSKIGNRFLDRYLVATTSGTTGEPGIFLQDGYAMTVTDVVRDRWNGVAMLKLDTVRRFLQNGFKSVLIAVGGGHFVGASNVASFQREHPFLGDRIRLYSPKQPLEGLVDSLNEYQPTLLGGYATVLVELAREQREGRLRLTPALVQPTAEPISRAQKRELGRTFGCTVQELYGATEFHPIAGECSNGNLHANTDWVVLEPVDHDYQPVEPGKPSDTVLLTNLANRIQPLVRYDLGDSTTMYEESCSCGSPFPVIEIGGRQGDILHFEGECRERIPVFSLAISSVVEAVPGVHRAQVIQTDERSLRIRLDVTDDTTEQRVWDQVELELRSFLGSRGISEPSIEHASAAPRRDPGSGKFRPVWSEVGLTTNRSIEAGSVNEKSGV